MQNELSQTNKHRILNSASRLLGKHGAAGLKVRDIVKDAGLSTIGIYSHFQGKDGVIDALYIDAFNHLLNIGKSALELDDGHEALVFVATHHLDYSVSNEPQYRLIFGEAGEKFKPSREAVLVRERTYESLVEIVRRAGQRTRTETEYRDLTLRFWATLHGYASLRHHVVRVRGSIDEWKSLSMASAESVIAEICSPVSKQG